MDVRIPLIGVNDEVDEVFSTLMAKLASACPAARVNEVQIQVYARALQRAGLGLNEVRALFGRAIVEFKPTAAKPFPAVADLLELCSPSVDDAAVLWWAAFGRAAEAVGAYGSVEVVDGCAATALELVCGTWAAYCELDDGPAFVLKRQEFVVAYRQQRRVMAVTPKRLAGWCEATGTYPDSEVVGRLWVVRIGDDGVVRVQRDELALSLVHVGSG